MTGIEVIRQLKLSGVTARLVVVTAFPGLDTSFDAAAAEADGYVDGPLFGDEVIEVVQQAIDGPLPIRHPRSRPGADHVAGSPWQSHRPATSRLGVDPRIREVMRRIDSDLTRVCSAAELASSVGRSESWLRRVFPTATGLSPWAYRHQRRLQEAARRLTTTHDSVQQIAYGLGYSFSSLREFREAFHSRFGMSPKDYRTRFWRGSCR